MLSDGCVIFDTETTGLFPGIEEGDEILTISVIDRDGNCIFDGQYKPRWNTDWTEASKVNGIWPKDVEGLPTIDSDIPKLKAIFDDADEVLGYNVSFDLGFLSCLGIEVDPAKVTREPMLEFAEYYGEWSDYFGEWKWKKLAFAARYVGHDWEGAKAHGSLADARATLSVIKWLDDHKGEKRLDRRKGNLR